MLKSFEYINALEENLIKLEDLNLITRFFIKLSINQQVNIFIASDEKLTEDILINHLEDVGLESTVIIKLRDSNRKLLLNFEFYTTIERQSEYDYLFGNGNIDLGLRRSLDALLTERESKTNNKDYNLVTFYSYKGGVGRTTSLALTATYLARKGKKVFVLDCDFEAPGLINFFNTSQSDNQKSGVVEYLNDMLFDQSVSIEQYTQNVEKAYSGSGTINLMSAGNILGEEQDLNSYLEGLSRIDLQSTCLVDTFNDLFTRIQETYEPDVILVDSRTGFNNIFGALAQLSKMLVSLAGDDIQNLAGTNYVAKLLANSNVTLCFVLSILSASFTKRHNNFKSYIEDVSGFDTQTFYFDRQNTLEFIGTPLGDPDDLDDFINGESGSSQYQKFFTFIEENLEANLNSDIETDGIEDSKQTELPIVDKVETLDSTDNSNNQDVILANLSKNLPDLYAENIPYDAEYIDGYFYIRPCMEDLFIPEKTLLLGDKGTGKTAFYKALQVISIFDLLVKKSQKQHLNYRVLNITNYEDDSFELLGLPDTLIKDELFIKKLWIVYIWNAIASRGNFETNLNEYRIDYSKTSAIDDLVSLVKNSEIFIKVENEIDEFNNKLKTKNERLIITFDMLDNIIKPYLWNDLVSPLLKLSLKSSWSNISPKLFLRRDLYDRLGNLTNKNSFRTRIVDLEWSRNEIYSFFLKVIFTFSNKEFFSFLKGKLNDSLINEIDKKIRKKGSRNQLPLDTHLIRPVINEFFGLSKPNNSGKQSTAYEDLYRNIQSADNTVNLRPFLDLLKYAIKEQTEQDEQKDFRKNSVLGLAYCTSKSVRKSAVIRYLEDLWGEQGNELVKFFCEDFSTNKVKSSYRKSKLDERQFDALLSDIKDRHKDDSVVAKSTITEFKQLLLANKIITPYMVGNKNRYRFAYLYTNYFGV